MSKLRSFMYMNDTVIEDYISVIDGYLSAEETHTKTDGLIMNGTIENGLPISGGSGQIGSASNNEIKKCVRISDASKFQTIYQYLEDNEELKYFDSMDEAQWLKLRRDDFIEILVNVRFSKLKETINAVNQMAAFGQIFESFTETPLIDKKANEAINGLNALGTMQSDDKLSCVLTFENNRQYPFITYLDNEFLKQDLSRFVGQFYVLCKVQSKIEKGKKILLDELFGSMNNLPMSREKRRALPKNMKNPNEIRDIIHGPATEVMPLAIYR